MTNEIFQKQLKNQRGVFGWGKSAKRFLPFLVYSQLRQDRQLYFLDSGGFLTCEPVRAFYRRGTAVYTADKALSLQLRIRDSRLHTADTSLSVQQCLRQKVYRQKRDELVDRLKLEFSSNKCSILESRWPNEYETRVFI